MPCEKVCSTHMGTVKAKISQCCLIRTFDASLLSHRQPVLSDLDLRCQLTRSYRGHPRAFREGEVLRQFQGFRKKFWSKFWISLYILYIFTSPSAPQGEVSQLRETFSPKLPSRMTSGHRKLYNIPADSKGT